jgi:hypothetical protein
MAQLTIRHATVNQRTSPSTPQASTAPAVTVFAPFPHLLVPRNDRRVRKRQHNLGGCSIAFLSHVDLVLLWSLHARKRVLLFHLWCWRSMLLLLTGCSLLRAFWSRFRRFRACLVLFLVA